MYGVVAGVGVPATALAYGIPLRFGALEGYACKRGTPVECLISDACYTIRDGYACKCFAVLKRIVSYACCSFGDNYTLQRAAVIEQFITYRSKICR